MIGCDPSGDVPWVCEISSVRVTYRQGTYQGIRDCRENDLPTTPESSYLCGVVGGGRPTAARGIGGTTPNTKHPTRDRNPFSARQLRQNNRYYIHHKSRHQQPREAGETCFVFTSLPRQTLDPEIYLIRWWSSRLFCCGFLCVDCQLSCDWWKRAAPICGSWTLLRKIIYVDDKLLTPSVHRKL